MINKILLILIVVLVCISLFGELFPELVDQSWMTAFNTGCGVAAWMSMLINGTFMNKPYFKIAYWILGGIVAGVLLKILHLTGANEILMLSLILMPILYSVHFFSKSKKEILDTLKWITVLTYFVTGALSIAHLLPKDNFLLLSGWQYTFWFTFAWFVGQGVKNKTLFNPKQVEESTDNTQPFTETHNSQPSTHSS